MGGGLLAPATDAGKLESYILAATHKVRPRVCFLGTASGDDPGYLARFYETYRSLDCVPTHLPLFRRTPVDLRAILLGNDVLHVGGGNTRSMLAVWRHWGIDELLHEAWERGVVLCGSSAGAICWFEAGLTDSVDGDLTRMACLGFLAGSACPHYDSEPARRTSFQRLIATGAMPGGFAADDGAALHFVDRDLHAVVSARAQARAYRVLGRDGAAAETPLQPLLLGEFSRREVS